MALGPKGPGGPWPQGPTGPEGRSARSKDTWLQSIIQHQIGFLLGRLGWLKFWAILMQHRRL